MTDSDKLVIALTALRDIAGGMNSASPPNEMLELGPGGFHQAFCPLLQRVTRETLAKVVEGS